MAKEEFTTRMEKSFLISAPFHLHLKGNQIKVGADRSHRCYMLHNSDEWVTDGCCTFCDDENSKIRKI